MSAMEVEFSPNQLLSVAPSSLTRAAAAAASADSVDVSGTLSDKLNALPLSRPDKVAEAKQKIEHEHYPPEDMVDRIATLLAINLGS
jgi:hypothetical protein